MNLWPPKVMVVLHQEAKVLLVTPPRQEVQESCMCDHPKVPIESPALTQWGLFHYENCVLLPCLRLVCCLLLGSLMLEIDTPIWRQTMFRQIPRRGGQELHCSCCAMWVSGWCLLCVCCSEQGRDLVESPRNYGNFLCKCLCWWGGVYRHCTLPSPHLSTLCFAGTNAEERVLLQSKVRYRGK